MANIERMSIELRKCSLEIRHPVFGIRIRFS